MLTDAQYRLHMHEMQLKSRLLGLHRILKDAEDYDPKDAADIVEAAHDFINHQNLELMNLNAMNRDLRNQLNDITNKKQ